MHAPTPDPVWIEFREARVVHRKMIAIFGGTDGVRSDELLKSALARPKNLCVYGSNVTIEGLAAAYLMGIIRDHPFVDGNKRTAYSVMRAFLELNGRRLEASQAEKYETVMRVAAGGMDEDEVVEWLAARVVER
ncbi:MAG: type II toxin-antitoxin system death-on-curing family toxin [Solirubrobacterales bacterium]